MATIPSGRGKIPLEAERQPPLCNFEPDVSGSFLAIFVCVAVIFIEHL